MKVHYAKLLERAVFGACKQNPEGWEGGLTMTQALGDSDSRRTFCTTGLVMKGTTMAVWRWRGLAHRAARAFWLDPIGGHALHPRTAWGGMGRV